MYEDGVSVITVRIRSAGGIMLQAIKSDESTKIVRLLVVPIGFLVV